MLFQNPRLSTEKMSLNANAEKSSLSLGVELTPDGSVIDSSIRVTASTIKVSYRLTYDDVDEMLEDGVAYNEECELGELYIAAKTRRDYRIRNGSAEAFIPTQIPQYSISTYMDNAAHNNIGIALNIQVSHNGGKNQSMVELHDKSTTMAYASPVSAASMLVTGNVVIRLISLQLKSCEIQVVLTIYAQHSFIHSLTHEEMMILAGEAIGRWKIWEDKHNSHDCSHNHPRNLLRIPFRTQPSPGWFHRCSLQHHFRSLSIH